MKPKKGQLDNLSGLLTALAGIAILMAVIFLVIGETQKQVIAQNPCSISGATWNASDLTCRNGSADIAGSTSNAYNASLGVQSAAGDIPGWMPIIVVAIIGGILLSIVRIFKQ